MLYNGHLADGFNYPLQFAPTCDYPNCVNAVYSGIAGSRYDYPHPSQWCKRHLEFVEKKLKKDPKWITKFQKGKIKGLPKDERTMKVYAY